MLQDSKEELQQWLKSFSPLATAIRSEAQRCLVQLDEIIKVDLNFSDERVECFTERINKRFRFHYRFSILDLGGVNTVDRISLHELSLHEQLKAQSELMKTKEIKIIELEKEISVLYRKARRWERVVDNVYYSIKEEYPT